MDDEVTSHETVAAKYEIPNEEWRGINREKSTLWRALLKLL